MKSFLLLALMCWCHFTVVAQSKTLEFSSLSHDEIFAKAKAENKSIMLFFHFEKCGACISMIEETFIAPAVIEYYKSNFISMSIDTEKGDGIALKEKYNISLQPAFLFFDTAGNLAHKYIGFMEEEEFIGEGKKVVENLLTSTKAEKMYNEGNRDLDFLIAYNYIADAAYTLDSTIIKSTFENIKAEDYTKEKVLKYMFLIYDYRGFIAMNYYSNEFQFLIDNINLLYSHFDTITVHNNMLAMLSNMQEEIIKRKDEAAFKKALSYIEKFEQKDNMIYSIKHLSDNSVMFTKYMSLRFASEFYKEFGDKKKYAVAQKAYEDSFWHDTYFLNNMAWLGVYYGKNIPKSELELYTKYALRAIALEDKFNHNLTYAWVLYRTGNKKNIKKAKVQLQKALSLANEKEQSNEQALELKALLEKV